MSKPKSSLRYGLSQLTPEESVQKVLEYVLQLPAKSVIIIVQTSSGTHDEFEIVTSLFKSRMEVLGLLSAATHLINEPDSNLTHIHAGDGYAKSIN